MLPGVGIPPFGTTNWMAFAGQGIARTWAKPPGCNWIFMLGVGGAGGGGGGQSTTLTARTGGGGGGSGGAEQRLLPAIFLPELIYIVSGVGGTSGAAAGNGGNGTSSSVGPNASMTSSACYLTVGGGNGGQAAGTGGSGGTAATSGSLSRWGLSTDTNGATGSAGGANTGAVGGSQTIIGNLMLMGGAGGASSSSANSVNAGGDQNAIIPPTGPVLLPKIPGGAAGVSGTTPGGDGAHGYNHGMPIQQLLMLLRDGAAIFSGGAGGGSGGASNGGKGGNGAWGCGGGGGGAGAIGGVGGVGGDGFVIIGAF